MTFLELIKELFKPNPLENKQVQKQSEDTLKEAEKPNNEEEELLSLTTAEEEDEFFC
ncbi:MAG: hypothetical protein IJY92_06625 [Alphaproteobacteria bacterium]|nr:hypothetical protein [Alphaproteobacteria bacterium]